MLPRRPRPMQWILDSEQEVDTPDPAPWPIPSSEIMEKRHAFHDKVLHETPDHRRVHDHENTGRNILLVLHNRELKGSSSYIYNRQGRSQQSFSKGQRSPSTVFDSPISTTAMDESSPPQGLVESLPPPFSLDQLPRRALYPQSVTSEVRSFSEHYSATQYHSAFLHHLGGDDPLDAQGKRPPSSRAVSTISVSFSPDKMTMASTHGDHTVKIACCNTGRLLQSLEGHPRTPWTVKYHPTDSRIVASGCLGHQVRLWNWVEKRCIQMIRLESAIISLSFHPSGKLLAVANGTRLHFWSVESHLETSSGNARSANSVLTEMDQRHMLRCVHFPPDGRTLIIGGVNPNSEDPRRRTRMSGNSMSFYLRLWDFDLNTALQPNQEALSVAGMAVPRRAISNVSTRGIH
jgi:activating molecule in BECN1-regulated autophagy protein 1